MTDLILFTEKVLSDIELQRELVSIESKPEFIARVAEMGREMGFAFSDEDVEAEMRARKSDWLLRWI